jgi:hypothetical protein
MTGIPMTYALFDGGHGVRCAAGATQSGIA